MITKDIYPKDFIKKHFIEEIGKIIPISPYLSFLLICGGIEFLGKCLDSKNDFCKSKLSEKHFEDAIVKLFPKRYSKLSNKLYLELRCGMVHMSGPGTIAVTQIGNDPCGKLQYKKHPHIENGNNALVIEYFYFDFVEACKKILSMKFSANDKMNAVYLQVGPIETS